MKQQTFAIAGVVALSALLAACGGGGGGSSPGVPPTAPISTPTPTPQTLSGTAVDYTAGTALAGFTVTVGTAPNTATCLATQATGSQPCGVPSAPLPTVTTAADGTFSVTVPSAGTYLLQIAKDTAHATLHRTVAVNGATSIGSVKITALSSDEQAWLTDVNQQRATVSVPTSFANLVVDEYAEEQARAEVAGIVAGTDLFGDPTEAKYGAAYSAMPGAMYSAAGVAALSAMQSNYLASQAGGADAQWFVEKANCTGGNWQSCTFIESTGHYINLSNTQDVWIGLGESTTSFVYTGNPAGSLAPFTEFAYAGVIIQDIATAGPAAKVRFASN